MKSIGYDCSDEGEIRAIIAKNELAIIFDLDRSLADQIKYAHKLLIERKQYRPKQRPAARLRTDKYITYLRILDAIDADPSPKQTDVAAALFPKIDDFGTGSPRMKLYYKQRKAAIDLRDKDYGALIEFFRGRAPE
jgi:hypothetical protein